MFTGEPGAYSCLRWRRLRLCIKQQILPVRKRQKNNSMRVLRKWQEKGKRRRGFHCFYGHLFGRFRGCGGCDICERDDSDAGYVFREWPGQGNCVFCKRCRRIASGIQRRNWLSKTLNWRFLSIFNKFSVNNLVKIFAHLYAAGIPIIFSNVLQLIH